MLTKRLKPIIHHIVSESQSAFIHVQLDNVLVSYELNHYLEYKTWGSVGYTALKLDLSEAYNRMEWSFLERVLAKLGFHPHFIFLIYLCVSIVSYSFLIDGQKFGHLHPQCDLYKGDSLSPYLFLFYAEALSHLLSTTKANGELQGVPISRHDPRVLHLLFADNTLIFCQATKDAMHCVGWTLKVFEESGLMVNFDKSSLAFSWNTSDEI
ncbi:hypothetical protein Sango_2856100 [Sesamum angolense]|uniref:Reverse transcriptase domain-containing protein n=1 Tax=Sesamum angolense TaxID=2727404 RepID=A0AAE1W0A8_9LAMI|nr:hypothetical protein Sango_2856100 [Sesamum angolense]